METFTIFLSNHFIGVFGVAKILSYSCNQQSHQQKSSQDDSYRHFQSSIQHHSCILLSPDMQNCVQHVQDSF
ncbi:CLUMA_CG015228, isoform A [Clunio marinus]|uniref:CLUMA_CG015228, isoform A n=1 Tax=Clunio marinus TaxID=568069 RepID=A0A1J1IPN5_9DIPT|nr:CLUMA_CG015228, isoform A [Clunio marinus]